MSERVRAFEEALQIATKYVDRTNADIAHAIASELRAAIDKARAGEKEKADG